MKPLASFEMEEQPDPESCGPTCLHAVYRHFGDRRPLSTIIDEVGCLDEGGTLEVLLGRHALRHGYRVTIYTYNLTLFDPTWFDGSADHLRGKLRLQATAKPDPKLQFATQAYCSFLQGGGVVRMEDLTVALLRRYLKRGVPLLTGLSATYLYQCRRERPSDLEDDDVEGAPVGHFVVLCGYDPDTRRVRIADPYRSNPLSVDQPYEVPIERVLCAILLGIVTYDASLMVVEPRRRSPPPGGPPDAHAGRRSSE